jgi:hypothetical protein
MRLRLIFVPATTIAIAIQLLTGGNFLISGQALGHVKTGVLVLLVAWAAVAGALTALPRDRALAASTLATIGLVFLAGATSGKSLMFLHYALALVAFTVSLASTVAAVRWSRLNSSR